MKVMDGIRVIDLSQGIEGSYCTKLLADYGAEVIKIEEPGWGDISRRIGPFQNDIPNLETSGEFLFFNTNKKSITLDIVNQTGFELLKQMLPKVDLIIENGKPEYLKNMGLDYKALQDINPKLVALSISDYGLSGNYKDQELTDLISAGSTAYMYQMGDPDKSPLQPGIPVARLMTGLYGAFSLMVGLLKSENDGEGQHIEISVYEAMVASLIYDTVSYSYLGRIKDRPGHYWATHQGIRMSVQPCKDGYFGLFLAAGDFRWQLMWEVLLGMPEIAEDTNFSTLENVAKMTPKLEEIARPWFSQHTSEEIFHKAQELFLPFASIPDMAGIHKNKHLEEREFFTSISHPVVGKLEYPGQSFRLGHDQRMNTDPAPLLGQHNREIFIEWLGLTVDELIRLRNGVII